MTSFISQVYIPSEIITKSSTSISHRAPNRTYTSEFLNEILCLTDDEMQQLIQKDSFKLLHDDIRIFYDKNKNLNENELTHLFEGFLHERNFHYIHDTCAYGNEVFIDLFSNLKPDMSWNSTADSRLSDYSSCPFFYKSIIELKTTTLKNKDYDQLSGYLTSILRYSPGRKFIIGCLTNLQDTNLIKVLYDDEINEIRYVTQAMVTALTGLEILSLYLELSDGALGYNKEFGDLFSEKKIRFLDYLGRGSSSFVFYCECQQKQPTKAVLKISRGNCFKEKYIIETMNQIKSHNINLIQCEDMNLDDKNSDYLIAFKLRGFKLEGTFMQHFLNNTQLLINTWKQINLCHRIGYVHSDIRIGNMIAYNNDVYVIDYSSAMQANTPGYYQGCLSTASNSVLKLLKSNSYHCKANEKISLYYSDDAISYLKTILLLKNYFKKYALLIKKAIGDGMPCHILSTYEYAMNVLHDRNIVKTLQYLERNRETLSIDHLQCIMVHTLENENRDNYDINEHLKDLSLSQ